ncbi:MAG TPA: hypothetical protein VFQ91_04015 [Bryobacteraceae bacterium]|nr:hypothetical protein [Bryobacteraceae bacterium]
MCAAIRQFGRTLLAILRELADENAYRRHLAAHGRTNSPEEYRRFQSEHFKAKYQRAKCC